MLKNREEHHSDDAVKKGYELRCEKIALCIAAFCVAALWCTKVGWGEGGFQSSPRARSKTRGSPAGRVKRI